MPRSRTLAARLRALTGPIAGAVAVALLGAAFLAPPLAAQSVAGQVLRSTDDRPILGVVILLVDDQEVARARTLSDTAGRFLLRAPAPGTYRLRTLRIGFRASTGAPFTLRADTTVRLVLDQIPQALPQVTAEERAECRDNLSQEGLATAILWDEARTAILAADITIRDLDYRFDMMLHSRKIDTRPPPLLLESVFGRVQHEGIQPWTSYPPDTLEERGYVTPTDSGLRYVAPDLAVLLSPYFTRAHCFRLRDPARTAPGDLSLEFRPVPSRIKSEIRGVLHFDAATRRLRTVEFSYVNLPKTVQDTLAGGEIEFAQLPTGAWIIPRWLIRAPIPVRSALGDTVRVAGSAVSTWRSDWWVVPTTSRIRVTGGDLITVRQGSSPAVLWSRATSTREVQVVAQGDTALEPQAGVSVAFAGSTTQDLTDGAGRVRFPAMVGGDYVVEVSTPYYSAFDVEPERFRTSFTQRPTTAREVVRVKTLRELAQAACGDTPGRAVLIGSVARPGSVVVGASVVARIRRGATSSLDEARTARARTTLEGRYAICDLPTGVEVFLTVMAPDGSRISTSTVLEPGEPVTFLDLAFPESPLRP